jgi:gamma-glutamylcyclotransferase (GGCT)/AIG2-like uncharacterized protein YtfP
MPETLFVYGTLHPDRAPAEIRSVARRLIPLGPATIFGTLHNLGEYPALILNGTTKQPIPGTVFILPDDTEALKALDRYEDFRPHDPESSLFLRARQTVTLGDGTPHRCWVYLYNLKLP